MDYLWAFHYHADGHKGGHHQQQMEVVVTEVLKVQSLGFVYRRFTQRTGQG
jgi:hypothetical protein